MDSRTKKLFKNTGIFAIGSFGSKLLSFIIIPFYTYVLTTSEYGKIDLLSTVISLSLPLTTLLIHEAVIRFLTVKKITPKQAISNCFLVFMYGVILILVLFPLLNIWLDLGELAVIFFVTLILYLFNDIFGNYLKAAGKIVIYSCYGLLSTIVFLCGNIIFVLIFKQGISGYFLSMLISQAISAIVVFFGINFVQNFGITSINFNVLKMLLGYSVPLIPNGIMWWIMNAGDKFIIYEFLGEASNGIYSLSLKLPTILSLLFSVFSSAWQLSSIEESDSSERTEYYNRVYKYLWIVMSISTSLLFVVIYPIFRYVLSNNYFEGYRYVGMLFIGTIASCYGTFLGVVYSICKKTSLSFISTLIGALVNLALNFLLVIPLKLYGVALGTLGGYVVVYIIRSHHAYKYLNIKFDLFKELLLTSIIVFQCIISMLWESVICSCIQLVFPLLIALIFRNEFKKILKGVFKREKI